MRSDAVDERYEEPLGLQAVAPLGRRRRHIRGRLADYRFREPAGFVEVGDVEEDRAEDDPDPGREAVEARGAAVARALDLLVIEVAGAQSQLEPARDENAPGAEPDLIT